MRYLFCLVMALLTVPVPVLQAAAPGVPPSKVMAGQRERRRRPSVSLRDFNRVDFRPFAQRPQMRVSPNGSIFFATDEEYRRAQEKQEKERRQIEEGSKRWKQMEEQFAQRQAEKGKSALITLAIVGAVLLLRFLVWLGRLGN